jgi:mono/diheme cytochrome c family protein
MLVVERRFQERSDFSGTPAPKVSARSDPEAIDRGRYLVHGPAACSECHGRYDRREPARNTEAVELSGGFEFPMGPAGTLWASNLTPDAQTGIGRWDDAMLARAIRTGVLTDGSLSLLTRDSAARLSDEDLGAVLGYLRSLPPVRKAVPRGRPGWGWKLSQATKPAAPGGPQGPDGVPQAPEPSVLRGQYLALEVAQCVPCHSPGPWRSQPTGVGSDPDPSHGEDHEFEFVAPNLAPDPVAGLSGRHGEDAFVARMRFGRLHPSPIMPWENHRRMTESDLRSIYRYLRTLPPVRNELGPTYRPRGWKPSDGDLMGALDEES